MKPHRLLLVLALLESIALSSTVHAVPPDIMAAGVVQALYKVDLKHFGFSAKTLKADRPYLAPDLYARLLKKANQPVPAGDAPDIEGDVIFNAQEIPTKYAVGKASVENTNAKVGVDLAWGSDRRHYTVFLKELNAGELNGGWKVVDIDYGKDGKLSDLLK